MSHASSPGRCCWPLFLMRCGGPSAVRTRTAAKRASSLPLVPFRQLRVCHLASASMSSAGIDRISGMCPLAGTAPSCNRPDQLDGDRVHLEMTRDAKGPGNATCREPLTERRAEAVTGIRQHTAEANTGRDHAIDLGQCNLWLGPRCAILDRNAGTL